MLVVATAGHVDHGKSTLVRALTGTDPDRFEEEKQRGLTIDLGFASMALPSGREMAFVDVPGHVRFIKNMLAGAGAVQACLFVVAATEGWKPQSEEHLRILELLGVEHGVVALTKVALVDADARAVARLELAAHVNGTFLARSEVVEVDAPSGTGLHELRAALDRMAATGPDATDRGRPRLWVDRSFAARGSGTVVTGTLAGGALHVGDEIAVEPHGAPARVRALQSHDTPREVVGPGWRTAVNLAGVHHADIGRGDAVVRAGQWMRPTVLDCSLRVLASLDHDVTRRGAYQAYFGSGEHPVAVRVLGSGAIAPGDEGLIRMHLPRPLPLLPGDRFVLRESGRGETVGGGEVLELDPVLPARNARPDRSVERLVRERGWIDVDELERRTGERRPAVIGKWVVSEDVLATFSAELRERIAGAGALGLDVANLDERARAVVPTLAGVELNSGRARLAGAPDPLAHHEWVERLAQTPFAPPPPDGVGPAVVRELVRRAVVVELDGLYFSPSAVSRATEVVAALLASNPDGVTVGEAREAMGTTRKFAMPLLAHLDATGVTRRRGDLRIAGPRLPVPRQPNG